MEKLTTMQLKLNRRYTAKTYTIGKLFVDGVAFCDTLEDTDRGLHVGMTLKEIKANKVAGKTAIPKGIYTVNLRTVSPRFKARSWARPYGGIVPRLEAVPGFIGVLVHPGNSADSTDGCLLVGRNTVVGWLTDSVKTYLKLMNLLMAARDRGEAVTIEIV